jgi:hypothetical protein
LNPAHALLFFLQEIISYMVTSFLHLKQVMRVLFGWSCTLVSLRIFLFCPAAALPHWGAVLPHPRTFTTLSRTVVCWIDYTFLHYPLTLPLLDLWPFLWGLMHASVDPISSFFTMSSWLSWEGWALHLPFHWIKSLFCLSTSSLSSSFSFVTESSQVPTNTCSTKDWLAWEQQLLAHDKIDGTFVHVHLWVWGWYYFTDVTTTSWAISSMRWESISFSLEHKSPSWLLTFLQSLILASEPFQLVLEHIILIF